MHGLICLSIAVLALLAAVPCHAQARDYTCFQVSPEYGPAIDAASDVAIVYGVGSNFPERAKSWRDQGYTVSLMTGIAWGGYDAYYTVDGRFRKEEVQTTSTGQLLMHGHSTTVGYNVPTPSYVEFIKQYIAPAIDDGVQAVYLEEPEFWTRAGWSEAFKQEWLRFYGEPWQPPDSSPDAQYRASRLKYEMYFNALNEVFAFAKARAAEKGRTVECHVPTHTLLNYAHWGIVSPESHLSDIPSFDGYIAQVWTGTARTPNIYRGKMKERTFETGFLEYSQMIAMVRPTGKKLWFLADPVEDNPNRSWNDYKRNYECTLVASLMWPEVFRFEVMPWPDRIFCGAYPKVDMDAKSDQREGIPADYATELLAVFNALNDMEQTDVRYDTGSRGVGLLVSDTLMFQRAAPTPSDPPFGHVYGLAMPLVKHGIPLEIVQLENCVRADCLKPYSVLLLSYEGQKPLRADYHDALAQWVRGGGALIYVEGKPDAYHGVREWWNDYGKVRATAHEDLFRKLGTTDVALSKPESVGKGFVRILHESPSALSRQSDGAETVMKLVSSMFDCQGGKLKTQHYLKIKRGPYVVAAVMDESVSSKPLHIRGHFVDLLNADLPIVTKKTVLPDERVFLADLDWLRKHAPAAKVVAAAARIRNERFENDLLTFDARGPRATQCRARILLPRKPKSIVSMPEIPLETKWDPASSTLWLSFENRAETMAFQVAL